MSNSRVAGSAKLIAEDWVAVGMKARLIQHYVASTQGNKKHTNFDCSCSTYYLISKRCKNDFDHSFQCISKRKRNSYLLVCVFLYLFVCLSVYLFIFHTKKKKQRKKYLQLEEESEEA